METIAERIKFLRIKHFGDRGRSAFAQAIGIPQSTYLNYEEGKRIPPVEILVKISKITGCDLNWLITGEVRGKVLQDNELADILSRLAGVIQEDSKARDAVLALLNLFTDESVRSRGVVGERASGVSSQNAFCPIIARSAAGLPAIWFDERADVAYSSLSDVVDSLEDDKLNGLLELEVKSVSEPAENIGVVRIVEFSEPIDLYGLPIDGVVIVDSLRSSGRLVGSRIMGDSMEPVLSEGDIIIVDTSVAVKSGDIVFVELSDRLGPMCKVYFRDGDKVRLVSENRKYQTIYTTIDRIKTIYKVIGAVKE